MTLSPPWRKLVLVLHVTSSLGFLGAVATFLALAITGATAHPELAYAVYQAMQIVTWQVIVPLAFATLLIGIVQSLGTPWGLFRYYWVIVKLVLTIIAVAVLMLQTPTIDALALAASGGDLEGYAGARFSMMLHASGGAIALLIATVLSVYKPRGLTSYGAAALGGRATV
jgi:hypothetical protein